MSTAIYLRQPDLHRPLRQDTQEQPRVDSIQDYGKRKILLEQHHRYHHYHSTSPFFLSQPVTFDLTRLPSTPQIQTSDPMTRKRTTLRRPDSHVYATLFPRQYISQQKKKRRREIREEPRITPTYKYPLNHLALTPPTLYKQLPLQRTSRANDRCAHVTIDMTCVPPIVDSISHFQNNQFPMDFTATESCMQESRKCIRRRRNWIVYSSALVACTYQCPQASSISRYYFPGDGSESRRQQSSLTNRKVCFSCQTS